MALPILDGNQTAATLSTIVTSGEHTPAHTVVSLGSQAIIDMRSAVSGSVVSISNFPASQSTTFGAVTGSVSVLNFPSTQTIAGTVTADINRLIGGAENFISIAGEGSGGAGVMVGFRNSEGLTNIVGVTEEGGAGPLPISGTVTVNSLTDALLNSAPAFGIAGDNNGTIPFYGVQLGFGNTNGDFETATQTNPFPIRGTVTISSLPAISGTVTVGNSVTIGSLPAISGTVTANCIGQKNHEESTWGGKVVPVQIIRADTDIAGTSGAPLIVAFDTNSGSTTVTVGNSVTIGSLPAISGTVTVGNSITIGSFSTSVTARLINPAGTAVTYAEIGTAGNPSIDVLSIQGVTSGTAVPVSISSVTIGAVPNGALTTRFGSVTTANTAQISSAVTNTSRRYLLIQNVTTSSNVITIGIGFTPTTTQGIQLSAGGGITFESSYIPTGAVYVLSSVTASPFTILEA